MIVKIFKTIGPRSYLAGFLLVFSAVIFPFFCNNDMRFPSGQFTEVIGNTILVFSLISIFMLLEAQINARKFDGIHLISFPTIYLFLPFSFSLKMIPILQCFMLLFAQFLFIKIVHSNKSEKWIFDLSLIISIMVQFNNSFSVFYVLPVLVLLNRGLHDREHLMALFLPALLIPFTFIGISRFLPSSMSDLINPLTQIQILDTASLSNAEIIWLAMVLLSIAICLFQLLKGARKFSYPELFSSFLFMTFWLSFSVVFGYLGLEIGTSPWFLSFIPAAYFFGILLKNINSDFNKNLILSAVVLGIIFFKLLDNGILTVELPFSIGKY